MVHCSHRPLIRAVDLTGYKQSFFKCQEKTNISSTHKCKFGFQYVCRYYSANNRSIGQQTEVSLLKATNRYDRFDDLVGFKKRQIVLLIQ